jgi:hypothetical protein
MLCCCCCFWIGKSSRIYIYTYIYVEPAANADIHIILEAVVVTYSSRVVAVY